MRNSLSRRTLLMLGGGTVLSGLSPVFPSATEARQYTAIAASHSVSRYAHIELSAGPYTRGELARIASAAGEKLGFVAPAAGSALGTALDTNTFPAEFALTLAYSNDVRMVIRATRMHTGPPFVTVRADSGDREFFLASA